MSHKQHLVQWQPGGRKKTNPDVTDTILFLKLVKQQNFSFSKGKEKGPSKHYAFKFYSSFLIAVPFFLLQVIVYKYRLLYTPFLFTKNTCNLMLIYMLLRKRELMSSWQDFWNILAQAYTNWNNSSSNVSAVLGSCANMYRRIISVIRKSEVVNEDIFKQLCSRSWKVKMEIIFTFLLPPLLSGSAVCFIVLLWWHIFF